MSHRPEQVGSVVMREVQRVITEGLSDPRLAPIITVTKAVVTKDLRSATVFVSVLPEDKTKITMHGLKSASRHIRHRISDRISLPRTPDLFFKLDKGVQNQAGVMRVLSELEAENEPTDHDEPAGVEHDTHAETDQ